MNHPSTQRYTVDVEECSRPEGRFRWLLRQEGKLFERADRAFPTREEAERVGRKALERALMPDSYSGERRRR